MASWKTKTRTIVRISFNEENRNDGSEVNSNETDPEDVPRKLAASQLKNQIETIKITNPAAFIKINNFLFFKSKIPDWM